MDDSLSGEMISSRKETTVEVELEYGLDDQYHFSHERRGVAVIIINETDQTGNVREGSEKDSKNFKDAFLYLGFKVLVFENKRKAELLQNLKKVSAEDHSDCDCFVLAVSSHGNEQEYNRVREDIILTTDGTIKTREILHMFTDKACPNLAGKPKIVFIQACRGNKLDDGQDVCFVKTSKNEVVPNSVPVHCDSTDAVPVKILHEHAVRSKHLHTQQHVNKQQAFINTPNHYRAIQKTLGRTQVPQEQDNIVVSPAPCYKDFVVMYATPPGYYAFRRPTEGSWFVKCLAEVLLKCDGKKSLLQMLTEVTGKVANNYSSCHVKPSYSQKKQTPVIYSMLCKDIYIIPKGFAKQ